MKFRTTILNGARWRGKGWSLPGVHDINTVYGTNRDFPVTTHPDDVKIWQYEQAVAYAGINQPDYRSWLNFEKSQRYIKIWTGPQWERWSAHMAAEYKRQMPLSADWNGQILYGASPDKSSWHWTQWENTHEIRIPNLVCGTLYSGPWQAARMDSLRTSAMDGYDICVFVSHFDQATNKTGSLWQFYQQIKMAVELRAKYVVYWDSPVGEPMRASNDHWVQLHKITGYLIEPKVDLQW